MRIRITHDQQQQIWEEEHKKPYVLPQMDSDQMSSGVAKLTDWLAKKGEERGLRGIELGCGKGRNVIGLAKSGFEMTGIDFSVSAIKEAKRRAKKAGVANKTHFSVHDATLLWPFNSDSFDLAIDCFATTDIESEKGRKFAVSEMVRVLKPGGYLLAYMLSPDDEYHKEMIEASPAMERNAFLRPETGKFEKTFDRDEILYRYSQLQLVEEQRIEKTATFFGKQYSCNHFWMIFQKPLESNNVKY